MSIKTYSFFIIMLLSVNFTANAQKTKPTPTPKVSKTPIKTKVKSESELFDEAQKNTDLTLRINDLRKFKASFPKSEFNTRASELIVSAFAQLGDEKLKNNEIEEALDFFKYAVKEAPQPVSDVLFLKVLSQLPTNLFYNGQQSAALEVAKLIEAKISGNAKQLLGLATFYVGIEDGGNAKNIADKALIAEPNSFNSLQTLGLANRLLFDLQEAEIAYIRALELEPTSIITKLSLADMKRAIGKSNEAETLYREVLSTNADSIPAQNGLILSLFEENKVAEAESELGKSLEKNPNNFILLAGVGYWYAAHNKSEKAVEFASRAVSVEPRFVWGQIALARGLQRRPLDAERSLIVAQQYGNFPTLIYELATMRMEAGLYDEAVSELKKGFIISSNGFIQTRLGNRIPNEAKNFIELLSLERRVSIFQPLAADNLDNAERLRTLLNFTQKINAVEPNENEINIAADEFIKGNDAAKTHRQLYVASRLLQKNIALPKVLELSQEAVKGVDAAAIIPNASSATIADELYSSRQNAFSRGATVNVPEIPKQTLTNILRGRIEEFSGWTLYLQQKYPEAIIRLKRAIGILPDKSIWFRNTQWKLAAAYDANGNQKEALDLYIKSYKTSEPSISRYTTIEMLYQKLNGSLNGLKEQIGDKPQILSNTITKVEPTPTPKVEPTPTPVPTIEPTPIAEVTPTPAPTVETSPTPTPTVEPTPTIVEKTPIPQPVPTPTPTPLETPEPIATPTPNENPKPLFTPKVIVVGQKKPDETSPDSRPRVVEDKPECSLSFSQESVSILSNGGRLGILMTLEGNGKIEEIVVTPSSKDDIEVTAETEIVKNSNKVFYVIKSITEKTGEFMIVFESPCGKKEILVRVR